MTPEELRSFGLVLITVLVGLWFLWRPGESSGTRTGPHTCPRCKGATEISAGEGKGMKKCPACRGCGYVTGVERTYTLEQACKTCEGAGILRKPTAVYPDGSGHTDAKIIEEPCPDKCDKGWVKKPGEKGLCDIRPYTGPPPGKA